MKVAGPGGVGQLGMLTSCRIIVPLAIIVSCLFFPLACFFESCKNAWRSAIVIQHASSWPAQPSDEQKHKACTIKVCVMDTKPNVFKGFKTVVVLVLI